MCIKQLDFRGPETVVEYQVYEGSYENEEANTPIEYCNLGPILEPFRFPIGEQSFQINFDLRINLGRTNEYETVLVDCEPNSDYQQIFQSQFMLWLTDKHYCEVVSK